MSVNEAQNSHRNNEEVKELANDFNDSTLSHSNNNWFELRVDGKLPERRAHHTSFMIGTHMYIYGGYDIREGPM